MGSSTISLGLGLGGGKASTSSGRPGGGGSFSNDASISLDGTNDYVTNESLSSTLTVEAVSLWFKPDLAYQTGGSKDWILSFGGLDSGIALGGNWFGPVTNELITVANANHLWSYTSTSALSTSTWYHLAIRWESSSSSTNSGNAGYDIFLNGTKVGNAFGTYSSGTGAKISADRLTVGARNRGGTIAMNYDGFVDEVAIFDSAISEADITAIYNSGVPASLVDYSPATWWRMGDICGSTGTNIPDQGDDGNAGTLTNGPTFSSTVPS